MPTFVHPALLWGLLIVGLPVLIHLINMFRHRRVEWAAMEFLLVSQKRNRTWVLFKQLLLLLLRMVAVATVVLMLAKPHVPNEWGSALDGRRIHHIVLLDDSYSMGERWGDTSAFSQAKAAAGRIAAEAARQSRAQSYSLIRFSQAARAEAGGKPDVSGSSVNGEFLDTFDTMLAEIDVSETAAGPMTALESVEAWLGADSAEQRIVYLLTDFRSLHWHESETLTPALQALRQSGAALHFVACVDRPQANTALVDLAVGEGTVAAGVPFFMDLRVANHSAASLRDVLALIEADGALHRTLQIPEVPARETVTERFSLQFPTSGEHTVTARLDTDALAVDDLRYSVVDVPADVPVLVIDGDLEATDARYLAAALQPGGAASTGLNPQIEKPRFLSQNPLDRFRSIFLLNVERLDDSAVGALEQYVAAGGGLAVFLGPKCSPAFYNEKLFRGGAGPFPVPLTGQETLFVDRLEKTPDLVVTPHPVFRVFAGQRNSFLATVSVDRYFAVPEPLPVAIDPSVNVIASLRNGAPLVVERQFGLGRVAAFLTTAGPAWNNWARGNPSYVVTMLEVQAYLTSRDDASVSSLVGDALTVDFDPTRFARQVRWLPPESKVLEALTTEAIVQGDGSLSASFDSASVSGVYQVELTDKSGGRQTDRLPVNVEPSEGDLELVDGPGLAATFDGVEFAYEPVATFRFSEEEFAGTDMTLPLFFLLLALLLVELVVAYWVSDHPPRPRNGSKGGAS